MNVTLISNLGFVSKVLPWRMCCVYWCQASQEAKLLFERFWERNRKNSVQLSKGDFWWLEERRCVAHILSGKYFCIQNRHLSGRWRSTERAMFYLGSVRFSLNFSLSFRVSFGCCGRFTPAELLSISLAILFVSIWVLTGHWLLMDGK